MGSVDIVDISLLISSFNRTHLFKMAYPTWFEGLDENNEHHYKTWPDEIIVVNDGGATDLEAAVQEMAAKYPDVSVTYKHRDKGHTAWSNPAIPHNWLVKQAKHPIVLIIDPETAFIDDGLAYVYSYYYDKIYIGEHQAPLKERRCDSFAAGTTYAIQSEFQHAAAGIPVHDIPKQIDMISSDPTSHQIIIRGGPAHEYRAWWKERYIAIGGKDERYGAWGYEDLDMEHRNVRFNPSGCTGCEPEIRIVTYGHLMPPNTTGADSTGKNEQLWRTQSPPDGVANQGKEWGIII